MNESVEELAQLEYQSMVYNDAMEIKQEMQYDYD